MSNAHASKQHGLTTMNTTRPKSLLRRRNNKHRSVARKIVIMEQRRLGLTAKVTTVKIDAPAVEKPVKASAPAKKVTTKTAVKKPAGAPEQTASAVPVALEPKPAARARKPRAKKIVAPTAA